MEFIKLDSKVPLFLMVDGMLFDVVHESHFLRILMQFEKGQEINYLFYFYYYEKYFVSFGILIHEN